MRPVLDFNALKIFIAVVERDGFVGAWKTLEMPTSNVSRCISQLEDKLNLQLIERSTRHMKLTQAGHLLYTRAKPLLEALEQTETEITFATNAIRRGHYVSVFPMKSVLYCWALLLLISPVSIRIWR